MEDDKSITIRILRKLVDDTEEFLKSPQGKRWKNRVDFIESAVRDKLSEYTNTRFEHFNFHDNVIRVLDNEIGKMGDIVELRKKGTKLLCGFCETTDCLHIKFVWSDPEMVKIFKRVGLEKTF